MRGVANFGFWVVALQTLLSKGSISLIYLSVSLNKKYKYIFNNHDGHTFHIMKHLIFLRLYLF